MEAMNSLPVTTGIFPIGGAEKFACFRSDQGAGIENAYTRSFQCIGGVAGLFTTFPCPVGNAIWMEYPCCLVGGKRTSIPKISWHGQTDNLRRTTRFWTIPWLSGRRCYRRDGSCDSEN